MANNFTKFKPAGINLNPQTGSVVTTEGDISYRDDIKKLEVSDGTSADNIVLEVKAATLSNKTLSGNTASNLVNGSGILNINSTGTMTVPNGTDTLVGKSTTDTFINKSIDGNTNTITNISNGSTSGTSSNTPNTIVVRDGSGNFSAGTITGVTTGNTTLTPNNHGVVLSGSTNVLSTASTSSTAGVPLVSQGASSDPAFGTASISGGGTGQTTANAAFNALSPMTTGGDLIYGGSSGVATRLPNGTSGQFLKSNGGTAAPSWTSSTITAIIPTIQTFLTGSGTYTAPTSPSPLYIKIKAVGGGGGGGGSNSSGTPGGDGNSTTFGSIITCLGGSGGHGGNSDGNGGQGASASISSPAVTIVVAHGSMGSAGMNEASFSSGYVVYPTGGSGGCSFYGGAGGTTSTGNGGIATGYGSGGGGASLATPGVTAGGGGGAGGYAEAIIPTPSSTYSYSIGSGGAGGAGAGGNSGGGGMSGSIIVEEYYQ